MSHLFLDPFETMLVLVVLLLWLQGTSCVCSDNGRDYVEGFDFFSKMDTVICNDTSLEEISKYLTELDVVLNYVQLQISFSDLRQLNSESFPARVNDKIGILKIFECQLDLRWETLRGFRQLYKLVLTGNDIGEFDRSFVKDEFGYFKSLELRENSIGKLGDVCGNSGVLYDLVVRDNFIGAMSDTFWTTCGHLRDVDISQNVSESSIRSLISKSKELRSLKVEGAQLETLLMPAEAGRVTLKGGKIEILDFNSIGNKVTHLDLLDLQIKEIKNCNRLLMVEYLDLSNNYISRIANGTFSRLQNLTDLIMNGNPHLSLEIDAFSGLDSLFSFTLQNYTDSIFNNVLKIPSLIILDISRGALKIIKPGVFKYLTNLSRLFLSRNKITGVEPGTFFGLPNLRFLHMEDNMLQHLQLGTFKFLPSLVEINLNDNPICVISPSAFYGLQNLKEIWLSHTKLKSLNSQMFDDLKNVSIVDLSYSNIEEIQVDSFKHLESLIELNLEGNRLKVLNATFISPLIVQKVILKNNPIGEVQPFSFSGLKNLDSLQIQNTKMRTLKTHTFHNLMSIINLDVSNSSIRHIELNVFTSLTKLLLLNMSRNELQHLQEDIFKGPSDLQTLDLSYSRIQSIQNGSLNGLSNLQFLHLQHNILKNLPCDLLEETSQLTHLYLSSNLLEVLPVCSFKKFPELTHVELNNNRLSRLRTGTFSPLANLTYMDLSENNLFQIDDVFFPTRQLKVLNLNDNLLEKIPKDFLSNFHSLNSLHISRNNWTCDDLKRILKDVESRNISIREQNYDEENIHGISCTQPTENDFSKMSEGIEKISRFVGNATMRLSDAKFNKYLLVSLLVLFTCYVVVKYGMRLISYEYHAKGSSKEEIELLDPQHEE